MNEKKICFILCVNDDLYLQECIYYIKLLEVPEGYEIDVISIKDADCMTQGYNAGMRSTDAKYKIYLHQDVFLVNKKFLSDILHVFEDKSIGMLGMVGAPRLPEHAIMWYGDRIGTIYTSNVVRAGISILGEKQNSEAADAEAIDGLLMVTQYDIPWREDIFKGWDFYDVSQSFEFRKKGYRVVVPAMRTPWCIHDDGFLNLGKYYEERKKFCREYME